MRHAGVRGVGVGRVVAARTTRAGYRLAVNAIPCHQRTSHVDASGRADLLGRRRDVPRVGAIKVSRASAALLVLAVEQEARVVARTVAVVGPDETNAGFIDDRSR